jgi:signal transduction histidine kinase
MHVAGPSKAFTAEITAAPMGNRHGHIDAIRWVLRDRTEAERAIEADRLAAATERKDEFIAMLGHELRNPLAAISLASQILTSETPGDGSRQRWAAEVVQRHADHLRQLVDDLLDVSRVSHGKVVLQRGEVDLRSVVTAAIESCQPVVASKQHEIRFAPPEQPVRIDGDQARLRQVLVNLIDNAAKYTPAGGRIEISLEQEPERVTIAVRDNGIGIPPSMVDRIFQLYEQVDGASDEGGGQGLGLGLALVQQLVALHGGAVRVESPGKGKGSSFVVTLPTADDPARASDGAQTRVLIVDDNTDAAELLADWLRGLGYSVEVAFDGRSAIAAAPCDVALVDLGLPDLDGFDLGRQLRGGKPAPRLVALTGRSDAQARDQATAAGFDRFLVKPVDPRDVFAALRELVDSSDS